MGTEHEELDEDSFNVWLLRNSVKLCVGILLVGIVIGLCGNRVVGFFISSETDSKFLMIDKELADVNDRQTRDEVMIGDVNKNMSDIQNKIDDIKVQQADISGQVGVLLTEVGDLKAQMDQQFGTHHHTSSMILTPVTSTKQNN